jgi:hypothetical protein
MLHRNVTEMIAANTSMKLTDEQFQDLFGSITQSPEVVGQSERDREIWQQGYSFAISQLYDVMVVRGEDEDDKYLNAYLEVLKDG